MSKKKKGVSPGNQEFFIFSKNTLKRRWRAGQPSLSEKQGGGNPTFHDPQSL
jgi:hypothetical protein